MSGSIYVTGDIHHDAEIEKLYPSNWEKGSSLTRDDYLIVTGDFSLLWSTDELDSDEISLIEWYSQLPWTTLFVDGNHENHNRLEKLPLMDMFGSTVGVVTDNVYHLKRGQIYNIANSKFFTMGGATSIDKVRRIVDISWWEQEIPSAAEFELGLSNLEKINYNIDYIVTHTMPSSIIDNFYWQHPMHHNCAVARYLDTIVRITQFKKWYFGHFHDDMKWGPFYMVFDDILQIQ